ncbi:MAG: GAF domain-containing protein [Endomicrobia bacterium]|nr:GAF domain-containing protein [Endomicrobiia bacterium]
MITLDNLDEIFELLRNLSSTLDLDVLLKRIGEIAEKLTSAEASSIMLVDDDKQHLYFKTAGGEKGSVVKKMRIKIGEGIAGEVALKKLPEIINDVSKDKRFLSTFDQESGFKTRNILAVPILMLTDDKQEVLGVVEVLNKKNEGFFTEEDKKLLENLASLASIAINNAKKSEDQRNFFNLMVELLVSAIETVRTRYVGYYWKVAEYSTKIARKIGLEPKTEEYRNIYFGSLLHDIGYLSVELKIQMDNLNDLVEKTKIKQRHIFFGVEIANKINLFKGIVPIIKYHHENYDGSGYPEGLIGEKIPLGARIIAIARFIHEVSICNADKFTIIDSLQKYSGSCFDPELVKIAIEILTTEY